MVFRVPANRADGRDDAHAAAHDVNNLLHVILGCCERLRAGLTPSQTEELDHIAVAAEHAAALAARVLGPRPSVEGRSIDLRSSLLRLHGLLRRILGDGVGLTLAVPPEDTNVRMHEGDLARVLVNLTVNARDAMPDGGQLTIDVGVVAPPELSPDAAAHVRIRVQDNGVGMSADVRERVFERFFTTKVGEGSGHGLATVQEIVNRYGGSIELRSEPGQGAEFTILLPVADSGGADQPVVAPPVVGGGETVLVVDDEPMAREVVVSFLEALGYTAVAAETGRDALELLMTGTPAIDLVVADVTMPDLSGVELSRRIGQAALQIPVLLVSGDTRDSVAADMEPWVEFLAKPFSPAALGAKVRDLLDRCDQMFESSARSPARTAEASPFDRLPAPVFVVQGGHFVYVNDAFSRVLRLPAAQLIGRSDVERVHPDDREFFPGRGERIPGDAPATTQVRVRCGDGSERILTVSSADVEHNAMPALLCTALDVTSQPDALTVAARMAALGRLAGGIAHDYNNLLLVIGGHLDRLRGGLSQDSALQADVSAITTAAGRATTLTDKLLSFGRQQMLVPEVFDLGGMIRDLASEVPPVLGAAITLQVDCAPELPIIEADPLRMREVLWHLIENAREAMPDGGTLTLSVDRTTVDRSLQARWAFLTAGSAFVRLRVVDSGRGMSPAVAAHAFEPFFTTKGKGRGAGMGLASVYGIVKQSGGYVFAEHTGVQGTCMTVLLPAAVTGANSAVASTQPRADNVGSNRRNRILLVEDDAGVRELLVDVLVAAGYAVHAAESAEQAETLAADRAFDLLLTDLDLPGMNGARLAARLTKSRAITVIIMSGYPDDGTIDSALTDRPLFLRKPFSSSLLLEQVKKALSDDPKPGRVPRASAHAS